MSLYKGATVFLLGASHRTAGMALRERLFVSEEELTLILPKLKVNHHFDELVAISTCNRFELFGVMSQKTLTSGHAMSAYLDLQSTLHRESGINEDEIRNATYVYQNEEAVRHIMMVASSLDSLVLGETQITGQFKDALALAMQVKTLGPMLARLGQEALATAKKVRTKTAIGKHHISISHAAIDLAKKVFGTMADHKFLVIGSGEMARVACQYILSYKPRDLYVANRTPSRAAELVKGLGFGQAYGLEEASNLIHQCDVVICSTAAPGLVLDRHTVARAQSQRRGRPLVLLDIAMPRDIDPACGKIDDVYLFDIDDLQQVVGANYEERRKAADNAMVLIDKSVTNYQKWLETLDIKPALASFRKYLDDLARRELTKTLGKESFNGLDERQGELLERMVASFVNKIAADASRNVMRPVEGYQPEFLADTLGLLFRPIGHNDEEEDDT